MENNYPWWVSSEGQGVAQRIVSLVALILPVLSMFGFHIAPVDAETFINAICIVVFAVWHMLAWIRYAFNKQNNLGKFQ